MNTKIVANGAFDRSGQKYVYQVRSDGYHLVWGHGLVHYRDQFKVDEASHRMMEKVKGRPPEEAIKYFERFKN